MNNHKFDPSLNILYRRHQQLDALFAPKSVAVIGATSREGSVGRTLLWNLMRSPFGGMIYPVNAKHSSILGVKAYASVAALPETPDLAVIVTPAKTVPAIIKECADRGVPTAVIISAGFRELGQEGILREEEIMRYAKEGKMRIIGPNCLGVMNPVSGLNATFAADMALSGNIAFISQSGALCTAVLDWSLTEKVGFSSFVSIGSMMDVNWGDLINYFGNDPHTKSILIYMESIGDPRSFLSASKEVALSKPIILIKAGRTPESAKAAASHTGALSGSDEVLNAALRRVGVLRVNSIGELFSMADILSKQPLPKSPNLMIVTNAGGPGVIATDALVESGGKIAKLDAEKINELNGFLPAQWSRNNPVDILGDASAELYEKTVGCLIEDEGSDGLLVILTPQYMTDATEAARRLKGFAKGHNKPFFASWMGAAAVKEGAEILTNAGIPTFEYPDAACQAFSNMWNYSYNLKGIYETPSGHENVTDELAYSKKKASVALIFKAAIAEGRYILTEYESKKVLEIYDIPVVRTKVAKTPKEALAVAEEIGFPVVLKLFSNTITHKSDVGGVKLNLNNVEAVKTAFLEIQESVAKKAGAEHFQGVTVQNMIKLEGYELILGSSSDPEFGPVLLFGSGGQLVEVFKDSALALPPLNSTLARRMMERTRIYEALKGVRGRERVDLRHLETILVHFSNMILEHDIISEFDINPLLVSDDRIIALDARIVLRDDRKEKAIRPAIRPYPSRYIEKWESKDKRTLWIRPIRPEDETLLSCFYKDLSERSVLQRYLKVLHYDQLIAHERLAKICFSDYDREISLVAEWVSEHGKPEIVALGRLTKVAGTDEATFALLVQDKWHGKGLGTKMLQMLLQIAKDEKVSAVVAQMLPENAQMQKMCKNVGFSLENRGNIVFASFIPKQSEESDFQQL